MGQPRRRRTQAERSAETRQRLLEATIDVLAERGWAGSSTTEICRRAGVSRGAQLHHFPKKLQLVTSAVQWLFERRMAEFAAAMGQLHSEARAAEAIDHLWREMSSPLFYAWLELLVAARTDPELRAAVAEVAQRQLDASKQLVRRLFPPPSAADGELARLLFDSAPSFAFAVLEGLALACIANPRFPDRDSVLRALELLITTARQPAGDGRVASDPGGPDEPR